MKTKNGSLLKDSKGNLSKGKIGSLIVMIAGALTVVGQFMQGQTDINALIQVGMALGAGLGIFGLRDAQK